MAIKKVPHILLLDIETSPILGWTWGTYQENVLRVVQQSKIICAAWQWIPADGAYRIPNNRVTVKAISDFPGYRPGYQNIDDKKLVYELWELLNEADVVIAQNGDSFDIKKINARFVYYGLPAPSAYQTVDTLKVAKKYFRFDRNTLENMGQYLEEGGKTPHEGFVLWERCMAGDERSWNKMKAYNIRDVKLLGRVYLRLRPFMINHPNLNIVAQRVHGEESCPACLSRDLQKRGFVRTRAGQKQRFQCNHCHTWSVGPLQRLKVVQ